MRDRTHFLVTQTVRSVIRLHSPLTRLVDHVFTIHLGTKQNQTEANGMEQGVTYLNLVSIAKCFAMDTFTISSGNKQGGT
jgi:hypothetical protein